MDQELSSSFSKKASICPPPDVDISPGTRSAKPLRTEHSATTATALFGSEDAGYQPKLFRYSDVFSNLLSWPDASRNEHGNPFLVVMVCLAEACHEIPFLKDGSEYDPTRPHNVI